MSATTYEVLLIIVFMVACFTALVSLSRLVIRVQLWRLARRPDWRDPMADFIRGFRLSDTVRYEVVGFVLSYVVAYAVYHFGGLQVR